MHYLRPARPTLLEVEVVGEVWGRKQVRPLFESAGAPKNQTVIAAIGELDLTDAACMRLFRLVCFNQPIPGWCPSRLLLMEPLEDHIVEFGELHFWMGKDAEIRKLQARQAAKASAEERRKRRQELGEERGSRSETSRHPQQRRSQGLPGDLQVLEDDELPDEQLESDRELDAAEPVWSDAENLDLDEQFADNGTEGDLFWAALFQDQVDERNEPSAEEEDAAAQDVDLEDLDQQCDLFGPDSDDDALAKKPGDEEGDSEPVPPLGENLDGGGIALEVPPAHDDPSAKVLSDDESDEPARPSVSASSSAATPAGRPEAFGCTLDLSDRAPEGCTLRRYESEAERKWVGKLPAGTADAIGKMSRSRNFRDGFRSEEQALAEVEAWLLVSV